MLHIYRPTIGDTVRVFWGYGLGFRAEGIGVVVKAFRKSVQVRLSESVTSPYSCRDGWEKGFVLKGIPLPGNPQWRSSENCVELI